MELPNYLVNENNIFINNYNDKMNDKFKEKIIFYCFIKVLSSFFIVLFINWNISLIKKYYNNYDIKLDRTTIYSYQIIIISSNSSPPN